MKEQQHKLMAELMIAITNPMEKTFDAAQVAELFGLCKAREIMPRRTGPASKKKSKTTGGKSAEGEQAQAADRILIQMSLNPFTMIRLSAAQGIVIPATVRSILIELIVETEGAELFRSGAPPVRSEREVVADHRKLKKRMG